VRCVALRNRAARCVVFAAYRKMTQRNATCRNTTHCSATHRNAPQRTAPHRIRCERTFRSAERFDAGWNGDVRRDDATGPGSGSVRSSMDSTGVRLHLAEAEAETETGHMTVNDGSGREACPCDVGPQLRRAFHEREGHGSNLSSTTKHGYKLPVVPNVKHNVTEKVAQVPTYSPR